MLADRESFPIFTASLLYSLAIHTVAGDPAITDSLTVSSVTSSSFASNFTQRTGVARYHLKIVRRHGTSKTIRVRNYISGSLIEGLRPDTRYYVTLIAEDVGGRIVEESVPHHLHTLPSPPQLELKTKLPKSVFVFFVNSTGRSNWTIQYREEGNGSTQKTVTSVGSSVHWLNGLDANTRYEIRAAATQVHGINAPDEDDVEYSAWRSFKTGRLSVFCRVDITTILTSRGAKENSLMWNETLRILLNEYASISKERIRLLRIESAMGMARVHYRIEIDDKVLPSRKNYTLSGEEFRSFIVNNGGNPIGTPHVIKTGRLKYSVFYISNSRCPKTVERYFIVTPEDAAAAEQHLNVAASDSTTSDEEDSLIFQPYGDHYKLLRDDGLPVASVSQNIAVGLTPRFIVRDCLAGNKDGEPVYSELLYARDYRDKKMEENFITTTDALSSLVNTSKMAYSTAKNSSFFTLEVPGLNNVIKYEILGDSDTVIGSLEEKDLDSSDMWRVTNISANSTPTNLSLVARVTFRRHDKTTYVVRSAAIKVDLGGTQCDKCSVNAVCRTDVGDSVSRQALIADCSCIDGFAGNGENCEPETTTGRHFVCSPKKSAIHTGKSHC